MMLLRSVISRWVAGRARPAPPALAEPVRERVAERPPEPPVEDLPEGYTYLHPHREGGLGTIIAVREERSGREVALKRLRAELRGDPGCRGLIEAEARLTATLQHPNIVPVYDMGVDADERFYYTMRLVPGRTLDEYVDSLTEHRTSRPARKDLRRLVDCLRKVCDAVTYAHAEGVLHLDLKPSNILVGDFGEVLLVDWGCAARIAAASGDRALGPGSPPGAGLGRPSIASGTPGQMAPEQYDGRSGTVGAAADIYQLGGILYEILTLSPPDVWWRRSASHRHGPRSRARLDVSPTVRGFARSVGGPLAAICHRACLPDPSQRYGSVREFAADIDHWLADSPVSAFREGLLGRLSRLIRGNPQAGAAIAASAVLVILFNLQLLRVTTQGFGQTLGSLVSGEVRAAVGGVSALQGLFESRGQILEPSEFEVLAMQYARSYPGIFAHSWVPRIDGADRSAFVRDAQNAAGSGDGPLARFTVTERAPDGHLVEASERDVYYPVRYIVPYEPNAEALGFDLASSADRRAMLEAARLREEVSLSPPVDLVQTDEGRLGVLAAAAVRADREGDSPVVGYITGVLVVEQMLASAWQDIDTDHLTIRMFDVTDPSSPTMMWSSEPEPNAIGTVEVGPERGIFSSRSEIVLFDRRWAVWVRPKPSFLLYYPISLVVG